MDGEGGGDGGQDAVAALPQGGCGGCLGAAPVDARVAGAHVGTSGLQGIHVGFPSPGCPPKDTGCQMPWVVRKLGRCDTPVMGGVGHGGVTAGHGGGVGVVGGGCGVCRGDAVGR